MEKNIQSHIYAIIRAEMKRPIPPGILMQKIRDLLPSVNRQDIYKIIDNMVDQKILKKTFSGSLIEGYFNGELLPQKLNGTISLTSSLDGYVSVFNEDDSSKIDYYVNNININGALNGDKVEIQLTDKLSKTDVNHAVVTNVIERKNKFFIGTFQLIGSEYNVLLDDQRNYYKVKLDDIEKLVNGHKILVEIKQFEQNNVAYGTVSRIIGHLTDIGIDIKSIIIAHNIETEFSPQATTQAESCKIDLHDNKGVRKDLSKRLIITIDPESSKDLDDAIHVSKLDNGNYFLSVSIADVSHYVNQGKLYEEALKRGTSVYLADRVIPMLPHYLSNNICSLNPQESRLCLTCDVEIDSLGHYHNIAVYPSIINSHYRLSYDEVNAHYNGQKNLSDELTEMLKLTKQLHEILRTCKNKKGYIDFDIKEPTIIVNELGWPIDIKIKQRGMAQKMIEDFMIAANECVTVKAEALNMPFLYRVHDVPSSEKLKTFVIEAKKLGFFVDANDLLNITPKTLAKWLEQNHANPNLSLISKLLLRCMSKAVYSTNNIGHFGLGSSTYTHFTSPIRRTPDLLVHRLFWLYKFIPETFSEQQRSNFVEQLDTLCDHCNETEVNAVEAEREVNQLKFCQYLSDHINEIFPGTISTIRSFGIFIELENTIEGLCRISNIGKDFWIYDPDTNAIVGKKTGARFNFGQKVEIRVVSVDIATRQINFEIVGFENEQNTNHFNQHRTNNRTMKKSY